MKLIRLLALSSCLASGSNHLCAVESAPTNQLAKVFRETITNLVELKYLLFLPPGYKEGGEQRWPLIVFLHGAGERGTNLNLVAVHGPPKLVMHKPEFPFMVISPQCPEGQTWSNDSLLGLLSDVTKRYQVDQSRIYLTGLSMGGFGTWNLALAHPDRFAAIAPICGGGDVLPLILPPPGMKQRLKELPVWVFHGGKDTVVSVDEANRMVNALRQFGNSPRLTVYPESGHDAWTQTYNNPELYDWFLQQQNPMVLPNGDRK